MFKREKCGSIHAGPAHTILVVNNHEGIQIIARAFLMDIGYGVLTAGSGEEAVTVFQQHREEITGIISDVLLPRMNGPALYARLLQLQPQLAALFLPGNPDHRGLVGGSDLLCGSPQFLSRPLFHTI